MCVCALTAGALFWLPLTARPTLVAVLFLAAAFRQPLNTIEIYWPMNNLFRAIYLHISPNLNAILVLCSASVWSVGDGGGERVADERANKR